MNIYKSIDHSEIYSFNSFLNKVFIWMSLGMLVTAITSYSFANNPTLLSKLIDVNGMTTLGYVTMFSPIAFVLLMTFGFNKFSYFTLIILFISYAAIMGASLSFIFLIYTNQSIFNIFIIATLMFGAMGFYGYSTQSDLTKVGNLFVMALVGIIIASLINMFMKSNSLSYLISFISVIVLVVFNIVCNNICNIIKLC